MNSFKDVHLHGNMRRIKIYDNQYKSNHAHTRVCVCARMCSCAFVRVQPVVFVAHYLLNCMLDKRGGYVPYPKASIGGDQVTVRF